MLYTSIPLMLSLWILAVNFFVCSLLANVKLVFFGKKGESIKQRVNVREVFVKGLHKKILLL